ncbi:TBC1 domain family member 30 isoform X4 [Saccopteryx leptura]|uniref:TBC1 domain family member 30 isoform X4 n=1 Tax=Saccopteryx leptura TaxID=249018 RepID=UPI00339BD4BE
MEDLPAGGGRVPRPEPEARPEDVAEEAVPEVSRTSYLRGASPAGMPRGSQDSWEGEEAPESGEPPGGRTSRTASLVSGLLTELYSCTEEEEAVGGGRGLGGRQRHCDSLDSSTEASSSDVVPGGRRSAGDCRVLQELRERPSQRHQRQYLRRKGVDTKLKFTLEPSLGQNGFQQWYDALKAVARLSTGIPKEWRRKVWLTLADHYLHSIAIDWDKTMRFTFNERSNPDDDSMGIQIVKDLHRTGCSSYCGQEAEQDRVVLKRVLLAYARWNKNVGYCQGFNILAALILEVVEGSEGDALKIMIYLIDKVLPEGYFVNNLQALSVDMAVFRDLLRLNLPELSQHLDTLQRTANKESGGGYEPPLTNVFTMQWFLTLFATCLPNETVLKIWDSIFFEGSEIILRVSLAIWAKLGEQIECCETADEFYSTMGHLTQEMLENDLLESHDLMQTVYSMSPFPFPQMAELREKYTYNITPFPVTVKPTSVSGQHGKIRDSDEENDPDDEDAVANAVGCLGPFSGLLAPELQKDQKQIKAPNEEQSLRSNNIAELSPGAINSCRSEYHATFNSMMMERMTTDINALKRQYSRIKKKQQQQVHQVYIRAGYKEEKDHGFFLGPKNQAVDDKGPVTSLLPSQVNNSPVINHLLLGKKMKMSNRAAKNAIIHIPGHTGDKLSPVPSEDLKTKLNSPWRTHIRVHKKNMMRTRSQPGCGDTVGLIDDQNEGCKASHPGAAGALFSSCAETAGREGGRAEGSTGRTIEGQSPAPAFGEADVSVVQVKLGALELSQREAAANTEPTGPPCPWHGPEQTEARRESKVPSKPPQGSHPKTPIFSPFPSIKPLRKSATARNLGLYGPTERTPTLHFPHMSRSFSKAGAGNSSTKKR